MTNHRRLRRFAAACAVAPGLFAGCANSSQFTAGRLPYGGAQTASAGAAPQDPFAARGAPAGTRQGFDPAAVAQNGMPPSGPGGQQAPTAGFVAQGAQPRMGAAPHQAAYAGQSENPFAQMSGAASPSAGDAQWATFEAPAAPPAETNPFAEIEGQPAITRAPTAEPLPTITPVGGSGASWQPQGQVATSPAEEFLPPVQ